MTNKRIVIACDTKDHIPIDQLEPFQGDLKSLSKEDYLRLRKEILDTGFAFPVYVWRSPDTGTNFILGGHQRVRVLKELRDSEGVDVPPVPVVFVEASSPEQAKRRVLQDVAQYGRVENQGLYEFVTQANISPGDLAAAFRLPDIDLSAFNAEFFFDDVGPSDEKQKTGSTELSQDDFSKFDHKCPRCGFEFDAGK